MTTLRTALIAAFFIFSGPAGPVTAGDTLDPLDMDQRKEIDTLIHNYIMQHPEVILESIQRLREKEEMAGQASATQNLIQASDAIYNDPLSPIGGNPDGSVTIVEFFDYRCGYCKRVFPAIEEILAEDKDIKIVFKEFPILGEDSVLASRAALATWFNWPDQYHKFHTELMSSRGSLNQNKVFELASIAGIDVTALKAAMKDEKVDEAIARTMKLAEFLDINGTPGFIIGNELIPGAIDIDAIRSLIEQARNNS